MTPQRVSLRSAGTQAVNLIENGPGSVGTDTLIAKTDILYENGQAELRCSTAEKVTMT